MPINYGTNDVSTTGTVNIAGVLNIDNLRLDGNTLSSTNSNGSIILKPTGLGALQADTAGNPRGNGANDFQRARNDTTMVASGPYSFIGGGVSNTASSYYCVVGGGYNNSSTHQDGSILGGRNNKAVVENTSILGGAYNIASGFFGVVVGGYRNEVNNDQGVVVGGLTNKTFGINAVVVGGDACVASGNTSFVGGGNNNSTAATHSFIPGGSFAKATRWSEFSHAGGAFSLAGDSQHSIFVLRHKTVSMARTRTLSLDGITNTEAGRLKIPSDHILSGTINIVGSRSTGAEVARYLRQFTIKNVAGTTSLVGSIIEIGTDVASGTTIAITADDANSCLQINVTRDAAETWRWVAVVDAIQMQYGS